MSSFNRVILLGNLTRDVDVRYTPGGTAVAQIGLAVNRTWFDKQSNQKKEETTFVDVTLWGRQAEVAGEYLAKGRSVLIEGRLQLDTWEDKASGEKRSKLKVVCESLQLLGGKAAGGDGGRSDDEPRQSQRPQGRGEGRHQPTRSAASQGSRSGGPPTASRGNPRSASRGRGPDPHDEQFDGEDVPF